MCLALAADLRAGETSYANDQIWRLAIGEGEPPALALHTTFGLRARSFRLFPRFIEGDTVISDPATFARSPAITHIYPNFIRLDFAPLPDINVTAEYWIPGSQSAAGRLQVTNRSKALRQVRLEWVGQLTPTEGQRMAATEIQATPVLCGSTGGLEPVVFLSGGARPGGSSFPSLVLSLDLAPDGERQFIWTHAALPTLEQSFDLARQLAGRKWEAESSRLEMLNAGQVEIYTGDLDWDRAFMLTQKLALNLFLNGSQQLPAPSFVLTRQPDQGHSLRGDGSDYHHLWNGQSPLEAYYLAAQVLPAAPALAQGLLQNFLAVQQEDGFIDWKPGLAGQRSRLLATPILASLAWRIYETNQDRAFLADAYPGLLKFNDNWFTPAHDRDGDGVPEWDHTMQSGAEDHPLYAHWHAWSQGVDISTAESPDLCAFLYRECRSLLRMAEILDDQAAAPRLQERATHLQTAVEASWDPQTAAYQVWDRDTHFSTPGEWLGETNGSGTVPVERSFEHPVRLLLHLRSGDNTRRRPEIFIHGTGASGQHRIERISDEKLKWHMERACLTSERVYTALERIEVHGLEAADQAAFYTAGYQCRHQNLLAPLWAGLPDARRARQIVENNLTCPEYFWRDYGIPTCPQTLADSEASEQCSSVNLIWNTLIGEGLLQYGFRSQAAELLIRLMKTVIRSLKDERCFRRLYNADTGEGLGERDSLNGLAPLSFFLDVLGVRLHSPHSVSLSGFNPFLWPVTIKYRGLTVLRQKETTIVIFPDGQSVNIDKPTPCTVSMEMNQVTTRLLSTH